jgi:hypothetical protein
MIDDCPKGPGPERDRWVYDAIASGNFEANFSEVLSSVGGHEARFYVFSDALKVGGVRVNVTAELQQMIADLLGCSLLTPKLADLIWIQREVGLKPHPRQITSSTEAMIEHSQKIDEDLSKFSESPAGKLICTVGKHWVLDNDLLSHPGMAENYGWHFDGPDFQGIHGEAVATLTKDEHGQYVRLIQGRGWRHDVHHVDYSQTCVLVSRACIVDGARMLLEDVLRDPALASLASHNDPLKILRQPGVPEFAGTPLVFGPELPDAEGLQV